MMLAVVFFFLLFLFIGVPISLVLAMTTILYIVFSGNLTLLESTPQRLFSGLDSFGLLAIPLFMLAGELMNGGGITSRLVKLAKVLLGFVKGGLAYVTVIANMLLASILGSATAQAAMMSKVLIPEMEREGYPREFAAALTLSSSIIAPIIPPSMIFIIYGTLSGVSIGSLFLAGIVPGLLYGVGFVSMIIILGYKYNFPKSERAKVMEMLKAIVQVLPAMLVPFIIIWGILSGVFTPTESAAIACFIAFIVGFFLYRELKINKLPDILLNTVVNTATVTFLIATANIFGWIIAFEQIPQVLAQSMLSLSESPIVFLMLANIFFLFIGAIIDGIAALIILVPVMMPLLAVYEINPIHFGVIISINLTIGLLTPPVGIGLFVVSSIGKVKFEKLVKSVIPFIIISLLILLIITYWSDGVLWIPRQLGL